MSVEYTKKELEQLHEKSLTMAKYFVKFCQENELLCYFCGGGCIGAVRHHGFIPWDDDLDFFMPRADYEKLERLWRQKADLKKYSISKPSKTLENGNAFITICDEDTTFIRGYQQNMEIPHGLVLDIFPLDGYPDSALKRKTQLIYAMMYSLFCTQIIPKKHGKLNEIAAKLLLGIVPKKFRRFCEKRMSRFPFENSMYTTELCAGPYYMKKKYPSECFRSCIWKKFEDTEMPIPVGYDQYLKIAFGNYMELPPAEKQKPHHECSFMDLSIGYKVYKGVYYCKEHGKG